jgi:HAD superfamily hydrolase (TIGR01509 family)
MKIAIMFDMDGVLIDSNPPHKIALKKFCEKYGYFLTEEQLRTQIYGRTNRDWITALFGTLSEAQLQQYAEEKEALFREIYTPDIQPLAGAVEFIQHLHELKIPKAIATSAPRANVDFVLEHTGLAPYFDTILDERFVTVGKPHPEIYLKTADALGFAPQDCVVFEDSLAGVQAGKAAGSKVIGISTTHTAEELHNTEAVLPDFTGLTIEILQKLVGL